MQNTIFNRLQQLDQLIRFKNTGNPEKLGARLGVSERTIYDYVNLMKQFGAPVRYDRERETYYYAADGKFVVGFVNE